MRSPARRGRASGYAERGPDRGRRRRPGEGLPALLLYLDGQLRGHRGRRQLAVSCIVEDLHCSPNHAVAWGRLLNRARVIHRVIPPGYMAIDRNTGAIMPTIAPWQFRPPDVRPRRYTTHWREAERLGEAKGQARRGPIALWSWLQAVRDQWARLVDAIRECKDQLVSLERDSLDSRAERPAGRNEAKWPPGGPPQGRGAPPPTWVRAAMAKLFNREGGNRATACPATEYEPPGPPNSTTGSGGVLGIGGDVREDRE